MSRNALVLGMGLLAITAFPLEAQLANSASQECPPGLMPAPQLDTGRMGSMGAALNPTGSLASAAKKKLFGSKSDPKADSAKAATPAKPRCLTQEQFAAEAKAQQSAAIKGAATAALTATPVGMAVVGAKAAAPVAGRVAGALSSRFHRGPNKDAMTQALATGRLEVENVSFDRGADAPTSGSDKSLNVLVDVLKEATGQYTVRVTPESDEGKPADPALARRRAEGIVAKLVTGGVPSQKIAPAPLTVATSWDSGPPKKSDAKLEIIASTPTTTTSATAPKTSAPAPKTSAPAQKK